MGLSRVCRQRQLRHVAFVPLALVCLILLSATPFARADDDGEDSDDDDSLVSGECLASGLGYKYAVDMSGNGFLLHWTVNADGTAIDMALEAQPGSGAEGGWFSAAWSAGDMAPSDAVVGNLVGGTVAAYSITGYDQALITPTTAFDLGAASMDATNGGSVVAKFSRTLGDGAFPVSLSAPNTLVWAFSDSGSQGIDFHGGNTGSVSVDFTCGGVDPTALAAAPAAGDLLGSAAAGGAAGGPGGATAPACPISSLAGYEYSEALGDSGLILHWSLKAAPSLSLALEAPADSKAATGWFALGWSADGRMAPADAIIANTPAGGGLGAFSISGYDVASVAATKGFQLGAAAALEATSGGGKIARFTRTEGDGFIPISLSGPNTLIWAFSDTGSRALDYHGANTGSGSIDFGACAPSATPSTPITTPLPPTAPEIVPAPPATTDGDGSNSSSGGSSSGAFGSCTPSSLLEYSYVAPLGSQSLLLHWSPTPSGLSLAVESLPASLSSQGWISVGWSADGLMAPADCVVGNLPSNKVTAYAVTGYDLSTVTPTASFSIGTPTVTSAAGERTLFTFSRKKGDGAVPINPAGKSTLIWAYSVDGATKAFDYHGENRGAVEVDFGCSDSSSPPAPSTPATPTAPAAPTSPPSSNSSSNATAAGGNSEKNSSGGCSPSSLAGFDCSVRLDGDKFVLHWTTNSSSSSSSSSSTAGTTIAMAAEVATTGWLSVGWSPDGKMAGSDAAIGNTPPGAVINGAAAMGAYYMSGYGESDVAPSTGFAVSESSVESSSNGKTVVRFTRSVADGAVPINTNGVTTVLWAYATSSSKELGYHGPNRGSASIDFVSGSTQATSSSSSLSSTFYVIHGWLLAIAFGLIMPTAILISRLFLADKLQEKPPGTDSAKWEAQLARAKARKPLAFETHKWMQIGAVTLAVAGCIVAIVKSGSKGLKVVHGQMGLAVIALCFVQPIIGQLRPNKGTPNRPAWFVLHWVTGVVIVGLAWVTTFLGLDRISAMFGYEMEVYYLVFGVVIGLFTVVYIVVFVLDQAAVVIGRLRRGSSADGEQEGGMAIKPVEVV